MGHPPCDNRKREFLSWLWQLGLIALVSLCAYANTFSVPFVFDDIRNIVDNVVIRDLRNFLDFEQLSRMSAHSSFLKANIKTRYVGYLSFAVNYRIQGLSVWGYHLFNLLIHIANGWLVYALTRKLLLSPRDAGLSWQTSELSGYEKYVPLLAGLLFVSHPLQTQAVTYIVQRFTSLCTLFVLATIVCYLNSLRSKNKIAVFSWRSLSFGMAVMGTMTKEFSVIVPCILLLWEMVFSRDSLRARAGRLLPFAIIPFMPFLLAFKTQLLQLDFAGIKSFLDHKVAGPGLSSTDYFLTQMSVFLTYVRLLLWPTGQNLDYDYPVYRSAFHPEVLAGIFLVSALVMCGFILMRKARALPVVQSHRFRLVAFLLWAILLTLIPESSILPINDVIFEHRMYAPAAWFFILVSLLFFWGFASFLAFKPYRNVVILIICGCLVTGLAGLTFARNNVWRSEETLWRDVVGKSPGKARPRQNLAKTLNDLGRYEDALKELEKGLAFNPDNYLLLQTLGDSYHALGRLDDAIRAIASALKLMPNDVLLLSNLATLYAQAHQFNAAEQSLKLALSLEPNRAETHFNLAQVYFQKGDMLQAENSYLDALKLQTDYYEAHYNLGLLYASIGKLSLSEKHYKEVIRIKPNFFSAYNNLAVLLSKQKRLDEAIECLKTAKKVSSGNANVQRNLDILLKYKYSKEK